MAKWPESRNKEFNAYLELAIAQGWADPVGFAERRMEEAELYVAKQFLAKRWNLDIEQVADSDARWALDNHEKFGVYTEPK